MKRHWQLLVVSMLLIATQLVPAAAVAAPLPPVADQPQVLPDGSIVGVPWTGERGITETVAQIMERERNAPPVDASRPRETKPWLDYSSVPPKASPDAPVVAQWPPAPAVIGLRAPLNPQTVGTSFKGVGVSESGYIPPDSMGDVGPTQILMHVNGRIKVFDKAGVLGPLNASDATFWSPVAAGISDPEVRYDRLSGRWFILAITIAETVNNKIVLAVSSGPTITGMASFTYYAFNVGAVAPGDVASFCDYPSLGIDANALYTGCNMFSSAGSLRWSSAFVIRKSSMLSGGPLVATGFTNITTGTSAGPYSPRGVDNDDPCAAEGYFIGVDVALYSRLVIRRVTDPGGTPTLSANINLTTPAGTNALVTQPARGSTTALDTIDDRLFMASIHQNKITGLSTLWTAQQVEVDATCAPLGSGTSRRIGARWYEIGSLTGTPSFTQSGTLCTTTGTTIATNSLRGFIIPTVAETGQGHMALGASFASTAPSPGEYAGVAVAGRLRTDPLGTIQAPTIAQAGLNSYTIVGGGRNRWGDYSFTDVDPNDDQTVWTFQEYADTPANNWSVRAVQLIAPPPPPSDPTPGTIPANSNSTVVVCDRSSGTGEFFDPGPATCGGPAYANHIAASATNGVVVNSITFNSPTQVTLDLNTVASTPSTNSILTITNPDGQNATCTVLVGSPLGVVLADFSAEAQAGIVHLTWETVSELDNAGFNLYRGDSAVAPQTLLANLPSQGPGSAQGFAYSYEDLDVQPGQTYWYWLEAVSLSGATTLHGPVSATVQGPTAVILSDLRAGAVTDAPTLPLLLLAAGAAVALALARRNATSRTK